MRVLFTTFIILFLLAGSVFAGDPKEERVRSVENYIFAELSSVDGLDLFPTFLPLLEQMKITRSVTPTLRDSVEALMGKWEWFGKVDYSVITTEALFLHDPELIAQMLKDKGKSDEILETLFSKAFDLSLTNQLMDNAIRKVFVLSILNGAEGIYPSTREILSDLFYEVYIPSFNKKASGNFQKLNDNLDFVSFWQCYSQNSESNDSINRYVALEGLLNIEPIMVLPVVVRELRNSPSLELLHKLSEILTKEIFSQAYGYANENQIGSTGEMLKQFVIEHEIGKDLSEKSKDEKRGEWELELEDTRYSNGIPMEKFYSNMIMNNFVTHTHFSSIPGDQIISFVAVNESLIDEKTELMSLQGDMFREIYSSVDLRDRKWVSELAYKLRKTPLFQMTYVDRLLNDLINQTKKPMEEETFPDSVTEGSDK